MKYVSTYLYNRQMRVTSINWSRMELSNNKNSTCPNRKHMVIVEFISHGWWIHTHCRSDKPQFDFIYMQTHIDPLVQCQYFTLFSESRVLDIVLAIDISLFSCKHIYMMELTIRSQTIMLLSLNNQINYHKRLST